MNILFICTHNRCRSILCESITNSLANGKITACSAGSQPVGEVHPLTLKYLQERHYPIQGLHSKSWNEEGLAPDIVITVCDSAASEACPVWSGNTVKAHWGLPDPSKQAGTEDETRKAFFDVMDTIEARIEKLLQFPLESMSRDALKTKLITIAGDN